MAMPELTESEWDSVIRFAWGSVRDRVEVERDLEFAHEHTLQFHFAWELARICGFSENLHVRFEVRSQAPEPRGVIQTDLIFWTDRDFQIAVEVKAPIRSEAGSNSAMTHGRMAFYKDIDRLRYLVTNPNSKIKRGMFLAVVNEPGYIVHRQQWKNLDYRTFHGTRVEADFEIPAIEGRNGCPYPLKMPSHPINWEWQCETREGRVAPKSGWRYYWLEPIPILPTAAVY